MTGVAARERCRALVAGFGRPGMRDLDFGRQVISYLETLRWPRGVVVEDLSYAAPLVLHRLRELNPPKLVLVGTAPRQLGAPGSLRRYAVDPTPPPPEAVQRSLEESARGTIDIDHTLAVARHWGGLPAETVIIEIEPADCSFGIGFSDELAEAFDPLVSMLRSELGLPAEAPQAALDQHLAAPIASPDDFDPSQAGDDAELSEDMVALVSYAQQHKRVRRAQVAGSAPVQLRGPRLQQVEVASLCLANRAGGASTGDWFEAIPLENGDLGVVTGAIGRRGLEAAGLAADLRAAARAYVVAHGESPAVVMGYLDRLVAGTEMAGATALYAVIAAGRNEVRFTNAGQCPLLVAEGDNARFLGEGISVPLGVPGRDVRRESTHVVAPGSAIVLVNEGPASRHLRVSQAGLERVVQVAAASGGLPLDDVCDRVAKAYARDIGTNDINVAGLRLPRHSG